MKRKHKMYSKPKRAFEISRINEEAEIKKEFGLKNKKEIWKAEAKIKLIREKAKRLISAKTEEKHGLFERLKKEGLRVNSIAEVLALDKKDYLKRRLQTLIVNKKIARTSKHARQLIVHKKILIDGKIINSPSYIVPVELENKISLKKTRGTKEKNPEKEKIQDGE